MYALAGILTVAFAVLEIAFLHSDFAFNTVAETSSTTTPTFYKAAAVWSSQEGSLLLWAWLLSLWSSLVLFLTRERLRQVAPYATAILLGFGGFFMSLMIFYALPVRHHQPAPAEGVGLDPLLRFPTHDDPSPDALLGLHLMHDPAGLWCWGVDCAAGRCGVDQSRPAALHCRAGSFWASAFCWVLAGLIPSSAGAATGPGTPSRTPL